MPGSFNIPFHSCDENFTFVTGIKRQFFYTRHAPFVKAETKHGSEFYRCGCLSSHDRADVWLADADNSVRYGIHPVMIHIRLLFTDFINHCKPFRLLLCQPAFAFQKFINIFSVPPDILELPLDRFMDFPDCSLFTSGQIQVIFSGISAVHPRCIMTNSSVKVIYGPFQIFPCLIQKIYILWKRDILWCTGGIQNQCPVIFACICFCIATIIPATRSRISRDLSVVLRDFTGSPVLPGNSSAYLSLMASHGMVSAFLTQRFYGFIFNPTD